MLLSRGFPSHQSTYAYVGLYVPRVVDTAITQRARSVLRKGRGSCPTLCLGNSPDRELVFRSILHTDAFHDRNPSWIDKTGDSPSFEFNYSCMARNIDKQVSLISRSE